MPPELAQESGPSPETATTTLDANSEDSSDSHTQTDAKNDDKETLLDVVRDVLGPEQESASDDDSSTSDENEGSAEGEEEGQESEASTQDPDADEAEPPFHKHPRWQAMKSERDELKPRAEQFDQITDFMDQNSLSGEEMADLFVIGGLMKSDRAAALEMILPYVEKLRTAIGETLPADLEERVSAGIIDEDSAKELSKTRAQTANLQADRARDEATRLAESETQSAKDLGDQMVASVSEWETTTRAKDPDFSKKSNLIRDRIRAIASADGVPQTADGAVALSRQAYQEITDELRATMPGKRTITSPKEVHTPGNPAPEPRTLEEAVNLALAG